MLWGAGIGGNAGRIAARVALVVMLLRVLVPPGFMPDFEALRAGRVEIALCSVDGARLVVLDRDGRPAGDTPADHGDASAFHCPFGLATVQAFVLPTLPPLLLSRVAEAAAIDKPTRRDLRPRVRGPPLGSRAPPVDLV